MHGEIFCDDVAPQIDAGAAGTISVLEFDMAERCRSAGAVADLDREQSSSVVAVDNGRVHFWVALGEGGFVAGKATQYVGCVVEGVGKFGIGIAAVNSLLHPNVTVYKLVEPCCSIEVAVAVFPTGSVPLPFGRHEEVGEVTVPARGVDVDDHFVLGGESHHGSEGVESVGIAAPTPVEVVLVALVVAVKHKGVTTFVGEARVFDGPSVVDFVDDEIVEEP